MKKTFTTVLSVFLVCTLCIAVLKPFDFSDLHSISENQTHTNWKRNAVAIGNNVCSYEDELYYTESNPKNIIKLTDSLAYVNNEVIVYFKDNTSVNQKQSFFDSIGATVIGHTDLLNKYQLQIEERDFTALQNFCKKIRKTENISFASLNFALERHEDVVYNDPWTDTYGLNTAYNWDEQYAFGGNWWLTATQTVSAWDYEQYFQPITVGILDSGFETTHEDLTDKFSFPSDFYARRNRPSSHGTHVAGIISANADNGIGIAGICNKAKLLCVDWSPENNQYWSTDERIFTGFIALVKGGAKVINMSLGSSGGLTESAKLFWNIGMHFEGMLYSYVIASLLSKGYDFLVVQSAGNGMEDNIPCDAKYNGSFCSVTNKNIYTGSTGISKQEVLNHILIVGSSTSVHDGTEFYQSSFSNYGTTVSIFAPGSSVFSTDLKKNGGYSYKSGTSMAAPVVTGIAALTWSVNPNLKAAEVKAILCDSKNSCYTCKNFYNEKMNIPTYNMVNAKLSVQAAIQTLPREETTTEYEDTTEIEMPDVPITPQSEQGIIHGKSDRNFVEQFRGEIGE